MPIRVEEKRSCCEMLRPKEATKGLEEFTDQLWVIFC